MPNKQTSVLKRFVAFLMSGLNLFAKAFRATYHQIWVSGIVLALVTVLFAIALFIAEHLANPDYNFWDALVWTFVKYVEDPADIVSPPVTVLGQVIGTLVGVLGIAIFAVNQETGLLTKVGYQLTGIHPRNFVMTPDGRFLLVACRDSNLIQIFARDEKTGLLVDTGKRIETSKPVCLKFL